MCPPVNNSAVILENIIHFGIIKKLNSIPFELDAINWDQLFWKSYGNLVLAYQIQIIAFTTWDLHSPATVYYSKP